METCERTAEMTESNCDLPASQREFGNRHYAAGGAGRPASVARRQKRKVSWPCPG
jgi:hypothetical protein